MFGRQTWQDAANCERRAMNQHEPMSKVDTAWLRMERPTNLMMITGVIVLEHALDIEVLRRTVEASEVAESAVVVAVASH